MISSFFATSTRTTQCRLHQEVGNVSMRFAVEGSYRLDDSKSATEGILAAIANWLNPGRLISSGRCRSILTPT